MHIVEINRCSNLIVAMNAHNNKSHFSDVITNVENYTGKVTKSKTYTKFLVYGTEENPDDLGDDGSSIKMCTKTVVNKDTCWS